MTEEVLDGLSKITLNWYYEKRKAFQREELYISGLDKIYHEFTIDDSYTDESGNHVPIKRDCIIDIDFINYCWCSDFLNSNEYYEGIYEDMDFELPFSLNSIYYDMLNKTNEYFKIAGTPNNIAAFVSTISNRITEILLKKVNDIKIDRPDKSISSLKMEKRIREEYTEVLRFFNYSVKSNFNSEFSAYIILSSIEKEYDEKSRLDFDVTQDELGALLYILNKAGFFRLIAPGDTDFINFCSQRFYYSKGVKKVPTKAKDLRRKHNESKFDKRILNEVVQKLKTAFKDL